MRSRICIFGFQDHWRIGQAVQATVVSISLLVQSEVARQPLMHELAKSLFKGATSYVHWRSSRNQAGRHAPVTAKWSNRTDLWNLIKLSLRHRPDLLIIGEIRDSETARAVVRASLTGATVFSTIHAKSIRGVYERLLELGVSEEEWQSFCRESATRD